MGSENKDLGQSIIRAGGPITAPDILENLSETSFNIFALGPSIRQNSIFSIAQQYHYSI
jgi:hypothetical protein